MYFHFVSWANEIFKITFVYHMAVVYFKAENAQKRFTWKPQFSFEYLAVLHAEINRFHLSPTSYT